MVAGWSRKLTLLSRKRELVASIDSGREAIRTSRERHFHHMTVFPQAHFNIFFAFNIIINM